MGSLRILLLYPRIRAFHHQPSETKRRYVSHCASRVILQRALRQGTRYATLSTGNAAIRGPYWYGSSAWKESGISILQDFLAGAVLEHKLATVDAFAEAGALLPHGVFFWSLSRAATVSRLSSLEAWTCNRMGAHPRRDCALWVGGSSIPLTSWSLLIFSPATTAPTAPCPSRRDVRLSKYGDSA